MKAAGKTLWSLTKGALMLYGLAALLYHVFGDAIEDWLDQLECLAMGGEDDGVSDFANPNDPASYR